MKNIQYVPKPIDTHEIELSPELMELAESLAKNVHEVWSRTRMEQGWVYGAERNDVLKQHPCLIEYEQLTEDEKVFDRNTALETLKVIRKLGFAISR